MEDREHLSYDRMEEIGWIDDCIVEAVEKK